MFSENNSHEETTSNVSQPINVEDTDKNTWKIEWQLYFILTLGVVILVENLLILVAAARSRKLRDSTHHNLVLSLSFADFFVGMNMVLYGIVIKQTNSAEMFRIICVVNLCSWWATTQISLLQTFYISFNRYLVISERKLNHILWKGKRKYIVYSISWIGIVILDFSLISPYGQNCNMKHVYGDNLSLFQRVYYSINSLLLCITILFYVLAVWNIHKRYKRTNQMSTFPNNTDSRPIATSRTFPTSEVAGRTREGATDSRQEQMKRIKETRIRKSMKLVTIIIVTLFILSGPMALWGIGFSFSRVTFFVLACGVTLNSILNPIIYCFHMEDLRNEIKSMFSINRNLS